MGFSYHSRIFHSFGDVTIPGEGLHILTCTRHSWPLSSEGSLKCHRPTLYNYHHRGPVTLTPVAERLAVELSLPLLGLDVLTGDRVPISRMRGERSTTRRETKRKIAKIHLKVLFSKTTAPILAQYIFKWRLFKLV